ncbi:MAG: hypothetical protein ACJ746_04880 [Bryobacteraceae bacterium]
MQSTREWRRTKAVTCIRAAATIGLALTASADFPTAFAQQNGTNGQSTPAPKPPPPQGGAIPRQEENKRTSGPVRKERWNLFWQATSVAQYHGTFPSPYKDPKFSLQDYPERALTRDICYQRKVVAS